MKLKIGAFLGAFVFLLSIMVMPVHAEAGIILALETEHNVGDRIEVVIQCIDADGDIVAGSIKFTFNTTQFKYISCSHEEAVVEDGIVTVYGKSITVVLESIAAGNPYIRADQLDANGDIMHSGGVTLTIHGETGGNEGGTGSNEGETGGNEGENGGNEGETGGENAGGNTGNEGGTGNEGDTNDNRLQEAYFYLNNQMFYVSTEHWNEMLELGFAPQEVEVNNILTSGLRYEDTSIILIHLINGTTGKDEGYFVFDPETQEICPYVAYGNGTNEEMEEQLESIQDNYQKLFEKYETIKQKNRNMLIGIILGIALLMIVIISILLYKRHQAEEEYEMDYKRTDGGAPLKKQGEYLNAIANNSYKDDEGLPKDSFSGDTENKKSGNASSWNDMDTDDVEVIDLEDL